MLSHVYGCHDVHPTDGRSSATMPAEWLTQGPRCSRRPHAAESDGQRGDTSVVCVTVPPASLFVLLTQRARNPLAVLRQLNELEDFLCRAETVSQRRRPSASPCYSSHEEPCMGRHLDSYPTDSTKPVSVLSGDKTRESTVPPRSIKARELIELPSPSPASLGEA